MPFNGIMPPLCWRREPYGWGKKVQLFGGFIRGLERAGIILNFPLQFLCMNLHTSSKVGTVSWTFLECKFGTFFKKARTASDKFITRLNVTVPCPGSHFSEPVSQSAVPSSFPFPCASLRSYNMTRTDLNTLRCSSQNCEVPVIRVWPKKKSPHTSKKLLLFLRCSFRRQQFPDTIALFSLVPVMENVLKENCMASVWFC